MDVLLLWFTDHVLPFTGPIIETFMLFRMAGLGRKLGLITPTANRMGMSIQSLCIGANVYAGIALPFGSAAFLLITIGAVCVSAFTPFWVERWGKPKKATQ